MINDLFTTPTMVDMLKFITMKYAQYQKMIQRNILNVVYCLRVEKFERGSEKWYKNNILSLNALWGGKSLIYIYNFESRYRSGRRLYSFQLWNSKTTEGRSFKRWSNSDRFHLKIPTFSSHALVWVHRKTISQLSQKCLFFI